MKMATLIQALELIAYEQLFGLAIASSMLCLMGSAGAWLASHRSAAFRFCVWQMVGVAILISSAVLLLTPGIPLAGYSARITTSQDKNLAATVVVEASMEQTIEAGESQKESGVRESASAIALVESSANLEELSSPPIERPVTETITMRMLLASMAAVWIGLMSIQACVLARAFYRAHSIVKSQSESANNDVSAVLEAIKRRLSFPSNRVVRLNTSSNAKMPLTTGIFWPTIVLPQDCKAWTHSKIEMVLAHELAHVERRDILWHLIMRLACCVAWFNPLVWRAAKNAVSERERACDDRVLQSGVPATEYGQTLVEIAAGIDRRFHALTGIVSMAEPPLPLRLRSILDRAILRDPVQKRTWIAIASFFMACSFALGIIRPFASPITAQPPSVSEPAPEILSSDSPSTPTEVAIESNSDAESEPGVVTGLLLRASDGSPVADATVILHTGGSNKTKSDEQGRFRLENIKPRSSAYLLWAHQANLVTEVVDVKSIDTDDPKVGKFAPLRLEMTEGKRAKFLITSSVAQKPIEGADVKFGYPDRRRVITDENGTAVVEGLLPIYPFDGGYDVTIEAEGHARSAIELEHTLSLPVTDVEAALAAGGIVKGRVVDVEGRPIAEGSIVYRLDDRTGFYGDAFRSDAEGNFQHRYLPLDSAITISADKPNFHRKDLQVTLSEQQRESEIQIVLTPFPKGESVAGTVTDELGKPIADATVTDRSYRGNDIRETKTGPDGGFVLHDVSTTESNMTLSIVARRFAPQVIEIAPNRAKSPETISVVLKPGHSIDGQIKLENGQPAKTARISVRSGVFRFGFGDSLSVDNEGRFHFDSLPNDARFDINLKGYASMSNIPLAMDSAEPIVVTLESPGVIRGLVVNAETKKPIPQFRVRLGFSRIREPGDAKGTYSGNWSQPGVLFNVEDGRFVAKPLTNQMPVEVIVEADGYERLVLPRVVASNAIDAQEDTISLMPKHSTVPYTLSVQLRAASGEPISKAQLRLIVSTNQPTGRKDNAYNWVLIESGQLGQKSYVEQYLSGVTDSQGKYVFRDILPGKYLQLAYWGQGVPKQRSLAFDETHSGKSDNVIIDIPLPSLVRGTVDRAKFPNAGSVRISNDSESFLDYTSELTDDQSTFEFRDLPPGKCGISVVGKAVRHMENGHETFRYSALANKELMLNAGDVKEIHFDSPDPPR